MYQLMFAVLGMGFGWLLWQGLRNGEIMGQGWMGRIRYYQRDSEPVAFYVTALSYAVIVVICLRVLMLLKA